MGKDYYKILNLPRTCKDADIKRSYRSLASKWHPDKCTDADAEGKFQDILEAHDILIDKEKRAIYDKHGEEGLKPAQIKPPSSTASTSKGFGGSGVGLGGFGSGFGGSVQMRVPQTQVYRQVNGTNGFPPEAQKLFQQFFGAGCPFNSMGANTGVGSSPFSGSHIYTSTSTSTSTSAPTSSTSRVTINMKQTVIKTLLCSLEDMYVGVTKLVKITRNVNGSPEDKLLKVEIPKGCPEGKEIVHVGAGDKVADHMPLQDIVFVVSCKPHETFTRIGDDLHMKHTVSIQEYINGFTVSVPSLDKLPNKKINIKYGGHLLCDKLPEHRSPNMGMPVYGTDAYGSLVLHISIQLPNSI